jgi:transcriptional regulator GlxA family with amidase domain
VTGSTPHAWLLAQRLTRAQHLLEVTELPVDEVARRSGLGAVTTLRHHFALRFGTSPQACRRTFSGRAVTAEAV